MMVYIITSFRDSSFSQLHNKLREGEAVLHPHPKAKSKMPYQNWVKISKSTKRRVNY